jgi:hypothetical protein
LLDISELWASLKFLLLPVFGWILLHVAKHIHRRWLRIPARAIAAVFLATTTALVMFLSLVELGCSKHSQLYSSDGKHVLVISYIGQGALGADYANIFIRSRWSPFAKRIFHGEAQWDFKLNKLTSPEVKWLDNSHLIISKYTDAMCENHAGNVEINCVK